jgi:hypothetical protein
MNVSWCDDSYKISFSVKCEVRYSDDPFSWKNEAVGKIIIWPNNKCVKYEGITFVSLGTRGETKIVSTSRRSLHNERDGCIQIERAYYSIFITASKLFKV